MEQHVQALLNRVSFIFVAIATLLIFFVILRRPETCAPHFSQHNTLKFPRSTCDDFHHPRPFSTIEKKNKRLWSTSAWLKKVQYFSQVFLEVKERSSSQNFSVLTNSSKSLSLLSGAGQEVMSLHQVGVSDVTAIDLVDSPPLVSRADPYNLPFFDDDFDFAFSAQFDVVLFPTRFVEEMERTVRIGGYCLLIVEECTNKEIIEISRLFKQSKLVDSDNFSFKGSKMTRIVLRKTKSTSN